MANAPAPELARLRDIHLPEAIGWWPLAPGWYIVALLLLMGLIAVIFFSRRYYKNTRAKRDALRLLASYEQQWQSKTNSPLIAAAISELLKRVALVYYPRIKVASLKGDEWILFLTSTSKGLNFERVRQALLELPYQPTSSQDLKPLFAMTRDWIRQRRRPCLN